MKDQQEAKDSREVKDTKSDVLGLYELAENVKVIPVNQSLLESYANEHRKYLKAVKDGTKITPEIEKASGSLNDYLQQIMGQEEGNVGKVLIGEISGDVGDSLGDDTGPNYWGACIEDADLSGCRIVNSYFMEVEAANINFRDCYFENVTFVKCNISNSDFRGANIGDITFSRYSFDHPELYKNIKLSYADPNAVQDLGVFTIEDSNVRSMVDLSISNNKKLIKEKNAETKTRLAEFNKAHASKQGYGSWLMGAVRTTEHEKMRQEGVAEIKETIAEEFAEKKAKLLKEKESIYKIRFDNVEADATYVPKEGSSMAEAPRLRVKATKADIEEYTLMFSENDKLTFKNFIEEKYKATIAASGHISAKIIPDLSKLDLSGMKLVGNFDSTDFSYSKLSGADCSGIKASGCSFEGASLNNAKFNKAVLIDCNMTGIKGDKADFSQATMLRARLEAAQVEGGTFNGAFMYSANISRANFSKAFLQHANLDGVVAKQENLS
jgi:uncharacterized protein YjbI with pentapeptide repeats